MKKKEKISVLLSAMALAFSVFMFSACQKSDVASSNSTMQDAISLMQSAASADTGKHAFDTTMCHGHPMNHGGTIGTHADDALYTHATLAASALPANVAAYIKANYAAATFKDAVSITLKSTNAVQAYLVLLDNAGTITALRFDGTGKFVDVKTGIPGKGGEPPMPGKGPGPH